MISLVIVFISVASGNPAMAQNAVTTNDYWWPNRLDLKPLRNNSPASNPLGAIAQATQDPAGEPRGLFYKWIKQSDDNAALEPKGDDLIFINGFEAIAGPFITSVDYPVIAHGGQLTINGLNLSAVTEVTIGGVSHTGLAVLNDSTLVVNSVLDAVPTGIQDMAVMDVSGTSPTFDVTVIHLVINEVEADSPAADVHEFIEIATGVAGVNSLAGYVVVLFNGGVVGGERYQIFDLGDGGMATVDGLMLIGGSTLSTVPQIVIDDSAFIQSGEDAIAIYQFAAAAETFPADYAGIGNSGLIDALVYESGDDTDRPQLYPLLTDGQVFNEGSTTSARETASMQRCDSSSARRQGNSFNIEVPTPGVVNPPCGLASVLPTCEIDFSTCPNVGSGQCGALFVAHGAVQCHDIGVLECDGGGSALHTFALDNRINIYFMGEVDSLETFLAPYLGTSASMEFFDIAGNPVGANLEITTDCNTGSPPLSNIANLGDGAVRRIQVTGSDDIWIDNFRINP